MPKYYMTFGCDQPNEGHVLPLIALNENQARCYMHETYNGRWCETYTKKEWDDWKQRKPDWVSLEAELPEVDITQLEC